MITKELAEKVLYECLTTGADFAEIYDEDTTSHVYYMQDDELSIANTKTTCGVGIRILKEFKETYGYSNDKSEEALMKLAKTLAGGFNDQPLGIKFELVEKPVPQVSTVKVYAKDIKAEDKIGYMKKVIQSIYDYSDKIEVASSTLTDETQYVTIYNTKGLMRSDVRNHQRITGEAIAVDGDKKESFSDRYGGNFGSDYFDRFNYKDFGASIAQGALDLLVAKDIPAGTYDVVIHNAFGGVLFHESCGHSLEATSVAKGLSVFSGKLGEMIASPIVTAVDDGTIVDEWGTLAMDDEGNDTKHNILISNGKLVGYMIDERNSRRMNMPATGSGRRESYRYSPTSRMTNTYIQNGKSTVEEIIAATKYGIFAKKMGGGSVNPMTGEFNFSVAIGYMIEDGKITYPVKGATLIGSGKNTLLNIDMVANNQTNGYGMCGSASGSIPACVGQPTIRVKNMIVGGKGSK